jgi:predicted alpha/beta hydrolase
MRARWVVHLLLIALFAASLATVTLITEGWPHLAVGSAFGALAVLHVAQRRHTAARLLGNLGRARMWVRRRGRLAWSDLVLALLTVNVLVSGTWDLVTGNQVILHPRSVGIPFRDIGWHVASALVLLAYLCVHVARRWGRLRRSTVR